MARDELVTPAEFGSTEVREVEVKRALNRMPHPYDHWALNPYLGCSHACTYCYVPDVAHLERPKWGSYVVVKRNLPTVLARELKTLDKDQVFLSSATDPYQPIESEARMTRRCLEILLRNHWPLRVLTRSPLVRRDTDLFRRFSDIAVGLSVPTLDDEARAVIEPRAPPIEGRLKALRFLADAGVETYANLMPAYPLTGGLDETDIAHAMVEAGVRRVCFSGWNYLPNVVPVLTARTRGTKFENTAALVTDGSTYRKMAEKLREAFEGTGVAFSS